jgi:hypothetical protein
LNSLAILFIITHCCVVFFFCFYKCSSYDFTLCVLCAYIYVYIYNTGSSYANKNICKDVVFLQGDGWKPGGFNGSPVAIRLEEDKKKGKAPISRPVSPDPYSAMAGEITQKCLPGYNIPRATGLHELDLLDAYVGEGGKANLTDWQPGKNGCVRIKRPGFYKDYDPNQHAKDYVGLPRHQEVLLPMGIPVANVLAQAEDAHKERLELFH